jgi:hypothetical protein
MLAPNLSQNLVTYSATVAQPQQSARTCRRKLNALLASKLETARAWELKETFSYCWRFKSVTWAKAFNPQILLRRHF